MSRRFANCLLLLGLILVSLPSLGETPLVLNNIQQHYALGKYLQVLEDPTEQMTFDEARSLFDGPGIKAFDEHAPSLGYSNSVFWIRLHVVNRSNQRQWFLEHKFRLTNYFDLYDVSGDGSLNVSYNGYSRPYTQREFRDNRLVFELDLPPGEERVYYLRLRTESAVSLNLQWMTHDAAREEQQSDFLIQGIFYGWMLLLATMSALMYVSFRRASHLYLAISILGLGFAYLFYDGYGVAWFAPDNDAYKFEWVFLLAAMGFIGLLTFERELLIEQRKRISFKWSYWLNVAGWGLLVPSQLLFGHNEMQWLKLGLFLFTPLHAALFAMLAMAGHFKPGRSIVLAFTCLLGGCALELSLRFGFVVSNALSEQGIRFGLMGMLMFLVLAALDFIRWMQRNVDMAEQAKLLSEGKFRAVFDQTFQLILLLAKDGTVLEINASGLAYEGKASGDVVNKKLWELPSIAKDLFEQDKMRKAVEQASLGGVSRFESLFLGPSGSEHWMDLSFKPYVKQDGSIGMIIVEGRDITRMKRAQSTIDDIARGVSASIGEQFFKNMVLQLSNLFGADVVYVAQADERNYLNTLALCAGGEMGDNVSFSLVGTPCGEIIHTGESLVLRDGVSKRFPDHQMFAQWRIESYVGIPLLNALGQVMGVIAVMDSVPLDESRKHQEILQIFAARAAGEIERMMADAATRRAQKKLALHASHTPIGMIEWNTDFQVVAWNPAAERIFGYTAEEAYGRRAHELIVSADYAVDVEQTWQKLMMLSGGEHSRNENVTKSGERIVCDWYNTPLVADDGDVIGVASLVADVTTELMALKSLAAKEREQREILNSMLDAVITIDETGIVRSFNKAAVDLFGYQVNEVVGKDVGMLMPPEVAHHHDQYIADYLKTGDAKIIGVGRQVEGQRKDGSRMPIWLALAELSLAHSGKRRFIGSCQDLTKIKQQEEQLRRSQKMDALGKLTGGIAHDFNNMLGVILGYADLMRSLSNDERVLKYANEIYRAGERGSSLTKKLLAFSSTQQSESRVVNINELLTEERLMLEKTLTPSIEVIYDFEDPLWSVDINSGEFEDVILNLSINAMHAMEGQGRLTFQTRNTRVDALNSHGMTIKPGDYVEINITDTGCGMDEETKAKIFDPFFSTKGDQGTGLGLSQAYGFLDREGGGVKVYSELDLGTRFALFLPRHKEDYQRQGADAAMDKPTDFRGDESILVVDDESSLAGFAQALLSGYGYRVHTAENAEEALTLLEQHEVALVISDIVMPGMDGYDLAAEIRKRYPHIQIQLTSGFTDNRYQSQVDETLHQSLIQKPYNAEELLCRVRELLNQGR